MRKEYFDELFAGNKTVILPGLGAFTKNSPKDKATFNPFLKFNDGLLASYLSKKLNISVSEAGKMLDENVKKIIQTLNTTGKVSVAGMGHFTKAADGKVTFAYDPNAADNTTAAPVTETVKEPVIKENRVVHEIKKDKKEEVKQPEKKPVVEAKKEEPKKESPANKFIKPKPEKKVKVKDPNAPKKKLPIVWIAAAVLVAGAATFTVIKWDMVQGWFVASTEKKEEPKGEVKEEPVVDTSATTEVDTAVAVEENPVNETPVKETPVKEKPVKEKPVKEKPVKEKPVKEKPVVTTPVTYGDFHVIVNCYQNEANATRMVSTLSGKGFSAQNLGNRGGYYMVSAGSASSLSEAQAILERAKSDFPKAWIYNGK